MGVLCGWGLQAGFSTGWGAGQASGRGGRVGNPAGGDAEGGVDPGVGAAKLTGTRCGGCPAGSAPRTAPGPSRPPVRGAGEAEAPGRTARKRGQPGPSGARAGRRGRRGQGRALPTWAVAGSQAPSTETLQHMRAFLQEKPENPHGFHFVAPSRSSEKGPAPERPALSGGAPGPLAAKLPGPSLRPRRARGREGDPAATSRDLSAGGGPAVPGSGAGWLEGRQALETRAAGSQPCPLPAQPPPGRAAPPGPPRRRGEAAPLHRDEAGRGLCRFSPATEGPVPRPRTAPPRSSSASPGGEGREGGRDGGRRQRRGRRAGPGRVGARGCPRDRRHHVRGHRARPCRGSRGLGPRDPAAWPGRRHTSGLKSLMCAGAQTGVLLCESAVSEGASVFPPTNPKAPASCNEHSIETHGIFFFTRF